MTQQEYENKRRECWEEFKKQNLDGEVQWQPVSRYEVFLHAFDRAYALGREKETITQEEIEKATEEYADGLRVSSALPGAVVPMLHDIAKSSYLQGAQDFLGKQETKQETDAESSPLWERLTEDEKREMQCRYHTNECVLSDHKKRTGDKAQSKAVARMKLLENLFGKENLKSENK